ncbi:MAG: response regulator transcription factor [Rhodocyclaceae bacterium]|nr:response regulator transcription factor [Rhodocyclaceae bacterium]
MTEPIRILLVDDEAPARTRLRDLLADLAEDVATCVVGEAADGIAALRALEVPATGIVDLALVDIRMPRMDGIEFARHLQGLAASGVPVPAVVFVTAFDQYAVKAFELAAVDYLLKPVRATRLAEALKKLRPRTIPAETLRDLMPGGRHHLSCTERGKILLVPVDEILFLKAELKYVTARTGEREYLLEESLNHLEEEFGERFLRVHRNCLVARRAIAGCEKKAAADGDAHWNVLLHGVAESLPVSRRQWPLVKGLLKE